MSSSRLVLEVSRLSTGYRNRPVIRGLSLQPMRAGAVTALVGPNAAGKSTLLRALAGLLPFEGSVRMSGEDLARLTPTARAERIGFMPQSLPQGVGLSILESVLSALRATPARVLDDDAAPHDRALRVLDRLGLTDAALEPLNWLSGGQRQLVSLAQAIVRRPRLLLLDEPTSALDLRHRILVMEMVRRLAAEGRIVVVVLHDLDLAARWADRIVVLDHGGLHVEGPPEKAITPGMLATVYCVDARVEPCSRGGLQVIADSVAARPAATARIPRPVA